MEGMLTVRTKRTTQRIPLDEIVYLENDLRKIRLHMTKGSLEFYGTFRQVQEELDDRFVCCSRSFILNLDHIHAMRSGKQHEVFMDNGEHLGFSKNVFLRIRRRFHAYLQGKYQ